MPADLFINEMSLLISEYPLGRNTCQANSLFTNKDIELPITSAWLPQMIICFFAITVDVNNNEKSYEWSYV